MTPPRLATYHMRDYCAEGTVHILHEREARYPKLIEGGKMTAAAAAAGLELARVVVAQWKWAMDPAGPIDPPYDAERGVYGFGAYNFELVEHMAGVVTRARAIADRDPGSERAAQLAELYEAIAWWQGADPGSCSARIVLDTTVERRCVATLAARQLSIAA